MRSGGARVTARKKAEAQPHLALLIQEMVNFETVYYLDCFP